LAAGSIDPAALKGFNVSDAHAAPADGAKPPKSKKMLIIIVAAVVLLGGGGAAFFMMKSKGDHGEEEAAAAHAKPTTPPTFLPLDSLVVNLADPGGDRFAQIGITIEISDPKAADQVKAFMPVIRSGILLTISQRTTTELLTAEGKEQLALDIKREVSKPLGFEEEEEEAEEPVEKPKAKKGAKAKPEKKPKKVVVNPIQRVLFSSFIVQ
jgi:flagellar FliL protein